MSAFKVYAHALNSSKNVKPLKYFSPRLDSSDHGTYIRKYVGTCCALSMHFDLFKALNCLHSSD